MIRRIGICELICNVILVWIQAEILVAMIFTGVNNKDDPFSAVKSLGIMGSFFIYLEMKNDPFTDVHQD